MACTQLKLLWSVETIFDAPAASNDNTAKSCTTIWSSGWIKIPNDGTRFYHLIITCYWSIDNSFNAAKRILKKAKCSSLNSNTIILKQRFSPYQVTEFQLINKPKITFRKSGAKNEKSVWDVCRKMVFIAREFRY